MSALEVLKQMQKEIRDLQEENADFAREIESCEVAIKENNVKIKSLEDIISVTVGCLNEEKKAEQEAFNTLLVKHQTGGMLTEDDLKSYAAERAVSTAEVYPEPETEEEAEENPQSSAA